MLLVTNNILAGARTINGRTSTSQTIRATVAVTVTASGEMLQPLVIFKGKPGGRIEKKSSVLMHLTLFMPVKMLHGWTSV